MALYNNLQDVFDKVWEEFVVNGRPQAMGDADEHGNVSCQYRTAAGEKCFIGVCIPDGRYMPGLEGYNIRVVSANAPGWFKDIFNGVDVGLMRELQFVHDAHSDITKGPEWTAKVTRGLTFFAEAYRLKVPEAK